MHDTFSPSTPVCCCYYRDYGLSKDEGLVRQPGSVGGEPRLSTIAARSLVSWPMRAEAPQSSLTQAWRDEFTVLVQPAVTGTCSNVYLIEFQRASSLSSTEDDFWVHVLDAPFEWFNRCMAEWLASITGKLVMVQYLAEPSNEA